MSIVDQHLLGDGHWLLLLLLHIDDLLSIDGVSIIKAREKETLRGQLRVLQARVVSHILRTYTKSELHK